VPQSVLFEGLTNRDAQMADERSYVNDVSKKYNLKVDYLPLNNSGCISEYPEAIHRNDEPPSLINGYIHSAIFKNLKAKKIEILFDGFDGDTTVSHGYEHLFELGRKFKLLELFKEYSDMHELYGVKKVNYMNAFKQYSLKSYIPRRILWLQNKYKPTSMVPLEWYKKLNAEIIDPPDFKEVCNNYNGLPIPNLYSKNSQYAHYLDVINPTIEMSLNLINHSASSYGLDIKFPFMDRRLIEFCLSIPSSQKLKNGVSRSILRRSLKNMIPDSIYNRHSKSDLSPFSRIEICNLSDERIMKSVLNIPFLDANFIKNSLLKNKSKNMMEIYQIIIFDAWLRKNNF
jgi:asparagine synthase (glutamine-hydrolysing)